MSSDVEGEHAKGSAGREGGTTTDGLDSEKSTPIDHSSAPGHADRTSTTEDTRADEPAGAMTNTSGETSGQEADGHGAGDEVEVEKILQKARQEKSRQRLSIFEGS